jgi:hypothetical protein
LVVRFAPLAMGPYKKKSGWSCDFCGERRCSSSDLPTLDFRCLMWIVTNMIWSDS